MPKDRKPEEVPLGTGMAQTAAEKLKSDKEAKQRQLDLIMGKSQVKKEKQPKN